MRRSRLIGGYVLRNGMFVPSLVKSIQRGTIVLSGVTSNTATIAAVNLLDAELVFLGSTYDTDASDNDNNYECRVELTNATTVTAARVGAGGSVTVSYEVIQYVPGVIRSVQRGTIAVSGVTSNTATVTSVNTAKSRLTSLGSAASSGSPAGLGGRFKANLVLTNATTITASKGISNDVAIAGYQLIEWF
jgi:hypothetical protein